MQTLGIWQAARMTMPRLSSRLERRSHALWVPHWSAYKSVYIVFALEMLMYKCVFKLNINWPSYKTPVEILQNRPRSLSGGLFDWVIHSVHLTKAYPHRHRGSDSRKKGTIREQENSLNLSQNKIKENLPFAKIHFISV